MTVHSVKADGIVLASLDDGRANTLSISMIEGLRSAIVEAETAKWPLVVTGRDGYCSAGFDLTVMKGGRQELVSELLNAGLDLFRAMIESPIPILISCTGHALAGGALLLLSADYRIGRSGSYQVGLNEVQIGMALPSTAVAIAAHRLERRFLTRATMFAEVVAPDQAVEFGYLDEVVEEPLTRARSFAATMRKLSPEAFATTKRRLRRVLVPHLSGVASKPG